MFQVDFSKPAKKDLKKLPFLVQNNIEQVYVPRLKLDPYACGQKLHGRFRECWKYKFNHQGVEYRIVYEIKKANFLVILIIIGIRENFYKELRRRIS